MFSTQVNRVELIRRLATNRDQHRNIYKQALVNYRAAVIAETNRQLDEFAAGKIVRIAINLPVPEDHTDDYDAVIGLMELSTEETVTLDTADYACYYLDQWQWRRAWLANSVSYTEGR
jgi:thymidine phosphorylase